MSNIVIVKNKYDKVVTLPPTHDTSMEQMIEDILLKLGVSYEKQFYFDETGFRKIKYDFALMSNSKPVLFIECDGESHYDPDFFLAMGNRPERNMAHVTKSILSDAVKTKLANDRGIPILRVNNTHDKCMQELIMSYVSVFVDDNMDITREILLCYEKIPKMVNLRKIFCHREEIVPHNNNVNINFSRENKKSARQIKHADFFIPPTFFISIRKGE